MILETEITDHFPILLCVKGKSINTENTNDHVEIKKINFNKLKRWAREQNWEVFLKETDPEEAAKKLISMLKAGIDLATYKGRRKQIKRKNWITDEIVAEIEIRDRLAKEARNGDEEKKKKHIKYRNKVNNMVKKAKRDYNKRQFEESLRDPKQLWKTINEYLNRAKKKKRATPKTITKSDGEVVETEEDIANEFNNYFACVGANLASMIPKNNTNDNNNNNTNNAGRKKIVNSMVLRPVTEDEIRRVIEKLKPRKAPGPDGITGKVLKLLVEYIAVPVTKVVNLCFEKGVCPTVFKIATVAPIHKAGPKNECNNYRPISLVSSLAKVFEKCIKDRLMNFINKYRLLNPSQYGFRNRLSTSDALAKFTSLAYNSLNEGKAAAAVFVDLAKAFDTLDHVMLLEKDYGIRGIVHKLFTSYLLDRKQMVKIENTTSSEVKITHGVPQGTILGPILFVLFINDIFSVDTRGTPLSYADDTVIFYKAEGWDSLERTVDNDFVKFVEWFNENSLTINIEKTQIMRFGCYKDSIPSENPIILNLNNEQRTIKTAKEAKYLGTMIDSQLRWEEHVRYIAKKLRSLPFMFKKLKGILKREKLMEVYHALFHSIATYGIIAWGGAYANVLKIIENLQKSALKVILGKDRLYPSDRLYREAEILPIRKSFEYVSILQLVKNKELEFQGGNTRSAANGKVKIPSRSKEIGRKSYDFVGSMIFNSLPANIRLSWEEKKFKNRMYGYLISNI